MVYINVSAIRQVGGSVSTTGGVTTITSKSGESYTVPDNASKVSTTPDGDITIVSSPQYNKDTKSFEVTKTTVQESQTQEQPKNIPTAQLSSQNQPIFTTEVGKQLLAQKQAEQSRQSMKPEQQSPLKAPFRETTTQESNVPKQPTYFSQGTAYKDLDTGKQEFIPADKEVSLAVLSTVQKGERVPYKPSTKAGQIEYFQTKTALNYESNPSDINVVKFFGASVLAGAVTQTADFGIVGKDGFKLPLSETVKGTFESVTHPVQTVQSVQSNPVKTLGETTGSAIVLAGATKIGSTYYNIKTGKLSKSESDLVKQFYEPTRKVGTVDVFTETQKAQITDLIKRDVDLKGFPQGKPKVKLSSSVEKGSVEVKLLEQNKIKVKDTNRINFDLKDVSNIKKGKQPAYIEFTSKPEVKNIEIFSYGKNIREYVNINKLGQTEILTQRTINGKPVLGKILLDNTGKGYAQLFDMRTNKPITKQFKIENPQGNIPLKYGSEVSSLKETQVTNNRVLETMKEKTKTGGSKVETIKPYQKGVNSITLAQQTEISSGVSLTKPYTQVTTGKRVINIKQSLPNLENTKAVTSYDKKINTPVNDINVGVKVEEVSAIKNRLVLSDVNKFPSDVIDISKGFKSVENPTVVRTNVIKTNIGGTIDIGQKYSKRAGLGSTQQRTGLNYIFKETSNVKPEVLEAGMKYLFDNQPKQIGVSNKLSDGKVITVNEQMIKNVQNVYVKPSNIKSDVQLPKNIQATIENPTVLVKSDSPSIFNIRNSQREIREAKVLEIQREVIINKPDVKPINKIEVINISDKKFDNKPTSRIITVIKPISKVDSRVRQEVFQEVRQEQRQEQKQELFNKPETVQQQIPKTKMFSMPKPPKQIILPVPFKTFVKPEKESKGLFQTLVRRRGEFESRGMFKTQEEAVRRGVFITGQTSTASFKVLQKGQPIELGRVSERYQASKKEQGVQIQKSKFRISSAGEKAEITYRARLFQNKNNKKDSKKKRRSFF